MYKFTVISRPKRGGKTYEIAQAVKNTPGSVVLVTSSTEKIRLMRDYGLTDDQVMTCLDFDKGKKSLNSRVVHIDNAEYVLQHLLGNPKLGTLTFKAAEEEK